MSRQGKGNGKQTAIRMTWKCQTSRAYKAAFRAAKAAGKGSEAAKEQGRIASDLCGSGSGGSGSSGGGGGCGALNMTRKCQISRAYHYGVNVAKARGMGCEEAKMIGRIASERCRRDIDAALLQRRRHNRFTLV